MDNIIGLKALRENVGAYINQIQKGKTFVVLRRSKPVFKISPLEDEDIGLWEEVVDFTKIKRGGIPIGDLISRL